MNMNPKITLVAALALILYSLFDQFNEYVFTMSFMILLVSLAVLVDDNNL